MSALISAGQLKAEEEQLWRYLEREVAGRVDGVSANFLEALDKMQAQISQLEADLDDSDNALRRRETELHNERAISADFGERVTHLERDYSLLLGDFEVASAQLRDAEYQLAQTRVRSAQTEKSLRARLNGESADYERRISELLDQCSAVTRERDALLSTYNDILSSHSMTAEVQSLQRTQLSDLMDRFTQISTENDRMKRKIELLVEDKRMMSQLLEERSRELADLQDTQAAELTRLQAQHANALRQLEDELRQFGRPSDQESTGVSPLDIDELDQRPTALGLMRGGLRSSQLIIPVSIRNIGELPANAPPYAQARLETVQEDLEYLVG